MRIASGGQGPSPGRGIFSRPRTSSRRCRGKISCASLRWFFEFALALKQFSRRALHCGGAVPEKISNRAPREDTFPHSGGWN